MTPSASSRRTRSATAGEERLTRRDSSLKDRRASFCSSSSRRLSTASMSSPDRKAESQNTFRTLSHHGRSPHDASSRNHGTRNTMAVGERRYENDARESGHPEAVIRPG